MTADATGAGMTVACPKCGESVVINPGPAPELAAAGRRRAKGMVWWLSVAGLVAIITAATVVCFRTVERLDLGSAFGTSTTDKDAAAINRLLDRFERAYAAGDLQPIAGLVHPSFVAVLKPADPNGDAILLDKQTLLGKAADALAHGALPRTHLFTERDIVVHEGVPASKAIVVSRVQDRWPDGRERESKELRLFVKEGSTWRVLLATPMFWEEKILVLETYSRSQANLLGLRAGDMITDYGGEKSPHLGRLIETIQRHFEDAPDAIIPLGVKRGAENLGFEVHPGVIGCSVETRLFPLTGAELIGNQTPHPVKETVLRINDAVRGLNIDPILPELLPRGGLVFLFTREGLLVTDPANPRAGLEAILRAVAPARDWSTYRCDEVRALVQGPIALVTCRGRVAGAAGEEPTQFANAHLFARQSGRWYWVAPLMDRVDIGNEDVAGADRQ